MELGIGLPKRIGHYRRSNHRLGPCGRGGRVQHPRHHRPHRLSEATSPSSPSPPRQPSPSGSASPPTSCSGRSARTPPWWPSRSSPSTHSQAAAAPSSASPSAGARTTTRSAAWTCAHAATGSIGAARTDPRDLERRRRRSSPRSARGHRATDPSSSSVATSEAPSSAPRSSATAGRRAVPALTSSRSTRRSSRKRGRSRAARAARTTMALTYFSLGPDAQKNAEEDLGDYYAWLGEEIAQAIVGRRGQGPRHRQAVHRGLRGIRLRRAHPLHLQQRSRPRSGCSPRPPASRGRQATIQRGLLR